MVYIDFCVIEKAEADFQDTLDQHAIWWFEAKTVAILIKGLDAQATNITKFLQRFEGEKVLTFNAFLSVDGKSINHFFRFQNDLLVEALGINVGVIGVPSAKTEPPIFNADSS